MDKIVFPILLSLLCGTVLSASLSDTNLNKEYEERLDQAKDRALKLITELIADDTAQDQYTGEEGANVVEINIPMLESLLANADDDGDDEVIDAEDAAQLILNALSSNERSSEGKRAGGFECLEESCGEIERRRKPNRNAHYRTLPFGKRVQRQALSTVRNTRKSAMKNKNKARVRPPLLPYGK